MARRILQRIVKGIYNVMKAMRRLEKRIAGFFTPHKRRGAVSASDIVGRKAVIAGGKKRSRKLRAKASIARVNARPVGSAPPPKPKAWWKDKYVMIGAGALVIAIVMILVFVLPSAEVGEQSEDTYASLTDVQPESTEPASTNQQTLKNAESTMTNAIISTTPPIETPIPTTEPDDPDLIPGCDDARIIPIQERLMELGYMGTDEPTTLYGSGTEFALQLFQRKHDLQVDGILGEQTLTFLFSDEARPYTVKLGDKGTDVATLQDRLKDLNYLSAKSTGYFGTDTESAVKSFQDRNGLSTDGNVGEHTREVLFSQDAREAKSSSGGGGSGGGSGGGGGSTGPIATGDPDLASADALVDFALTQLGKKYVRGGKGPDVFDCSGFVYYCLNMVGYDIRYMTSSGWAGCSLPRVEKMSDMKKGDIICFNGHVGIYMGGDKMVDASSSNGCIVTRSGISESSYWTRNFICARRVF